MLQIVVYDGCIPSVNFDNKEKTVDMIFPLVMIFRHGNVSSSKYILAFLLKSYCKNK